MPTKPTKSPVVAYITRRDGGGYEWWFWPDRYVKVDSQHVYTTKRGAKAAAARWLAKRMPQVEITWEIDL